MACKLTEAQREMLDWLRTTDIEVDEPVVADRLVAMGFAKRLHTSTRDTFYRITDAGRRALSCSEGA